MFFSETTFIGIDPTAGQRPLTYAALDQDLRLVALGQGSLDEVLAFAGGQRQAMAAVCAPRRPNQNLMKRPEVRESLDPPPLPGHWMGFRVAEYLLRKHNISCPRTPEHEHDCPAWMKMGFTLYRRLESLGYRSLSEDRAAFKVIEVYPHACYCVLLGNLPFPKTTLEGRLQRQAALQEHGVRVSDPMRFFEKTTRRHLLQGSLPLEDVHSAAELDALAAAYTAWAAASQPEKVTALGDPAEGQVLLPVSELKRRY